MIGIVSLDKENCQDNLNHVMQGLVGVKFPESFVFPITQEEIDKNDWGAIGIKIKEMLKKETSILIDSLALRYSV